MYKANGRDHKPKDSEFAKTLMRVFKCDTCSQTASFKSVQFGEVISCPVCGEAMYEELNKRN